MAARKILSLLLSALLLFGVMPIAGLTASAEGETPINTGNITQFGRNYMKNDTLYLYWANAGFAFRFSGTGATATLTSSNLNEIYRGYLHIYVDGEFTPSRTICLEQTSGTYVLAEGLPAGEHTIEVRKRNEAKYGGSATIGVKTLDITDGTFLTPPAAKEKTIEFVGDSITSGFGNLVSALQPDPGKFTTEMQDSTMTYAVLAAKALGAEANVLSRSGMRFVFSPEGLDKLESWYPHYEETATLPDDKTSCPDKWDFASHPSDVVVINLGTNDNGAKVNNQTISDADMTKDAVALIELVRKNNPDAVIIWTYGIMGNGRKAALSAAVEQVNAAGDEKVYYLGLANLQTTTEGIGTHGHPSMQTHINRSMDLAAFIAEKTGWSYDLGVTMQAQLQLSAQFDDEDYLADFTELSAKNFQSAMEAGRAMTGVTNEEWKTAIEKVQSTYLKLVSTADMSKEYIVIDTFDKKDGWSIAGSELIDTENQKQGAACLSTSANGSGNSINFMRTNAPLNITLPEDWENWFVEFWMYVDHPENIPGGSCLELSQVVDKVEAQWGLNSLGLQAGWNKVQLRMNTASLSGREDFQTLQNIRLFIVNLTGAPELTIKVDDMVLSKGKAAADIAAWQAQRTAAEEMLTKTDYPEAALAPVKAAYEAAGEATTQRDVDVTTENLKAAMEAVAGNIEAAGKVDALIAALPETVTAADRAAVAAAREAYEALTAEQKALVTKLAVLEAAEKALPTCTLGDIDGSGKVDTTDARLALQYAVEKITLTEDQLLAADVDGSGKVDTTDARLILQYAVEKIDKFPASK